MQLRELQVGRAKASLRTDIEMTNFENHITSKFVKLSIVDGARKQGEDVARRPRCLFGSRRSDFWSTPHEPHTGFAALANGPMNVGHVSKYERVTFIRLATRAD